MARTYLHAEWLIREWLLLVCMQEWLIRIIRSMQEWLICMQEWLMQEWLVVCMQEWLISLHAGMAHAGVARSLYGGVAHIQEY